jgi:hypothetical protein
LTLAFNYAAASVPAEHVAMTHDNHNDGDPEEGQ